MYDLGDALLFTLSAWRRCSWSRYRRAFDDLYARALVAGAMRNDDDPGARSRAVRIAETLGHCDVLFNGGDSVFVTPAVLARLPVRGLPRAVLCGSRSPGTIKALKQAARRGNGWTNVTTVPQATLNPFAPARVEVEADSHGNLTQLANDLGIRYAQTPPAWSLAGFAASVDTFMQSLAWSRQPDLSWPRMDFDPSALRFTPHRQSGPLVLRRYEDPVRREWRFWLWRGSDNAAIEDPAWARFALLAALGRTVIRYDSATGELSVPIGVRLPTLLARAAALCTGYAPNETERSDHEGIRTKCVVYHRVPSDVYDVLGKKLGQLTAEGETIG